MEVTKKRCKNLLLGIMLCMVFSLGIGSIQAEAAIRLSKTKATITVGKKVKLKVKGTKKKAKWTSSKKSVCTVSKSGVIKGKKKGKATIKAKVGKKTLKCKVTVKAKKVPDKSPSTPAKKPSSTPVKPTGLKVTGALSKIAPGGTVQLQLSYIPANATREKVTWYSSRSSRATVSDTGLVTAKDTGEVTITAELDSDYRVKGTFNLIIENFAVDGEVSTADGGDLLLSENGSQAIYSYTVSYKTMDVKTQVVDGVGKVIRTYPMGTLSPETPATVTWDLKDTNGNKVSPGSYCFQVIAAGTTVKSDYFTVYAKSEFDSGNGSPSAPYTVSTLEQLEQVGTHNGVCYKQTADIDADLTGFIPLFTADVPFTGTYDGGGYSISNVSTNINGASNLGIFSAVGKDGTIQNLNVENSFFTGVNDISAIVGINNGTINNCTVKGCSLKSSNGKTGAIVSSNYGTVRNCRTIGNTASATNSDVGGICAYNKGTVIECTSEEDSLAIIREGYHWQYAGGVAGYNDGNIIKCTIITVKINANSDYYTSGGGIAGNNTGTIANCEVRACELEGKWEHKGGIAGWSSGNNTNNTYRGTLEQIGGK